MQIIINDDHILGISLWNSTDAMNKYQSTTFPKIEQSLSKLSSAKPTVETFVLPSELKVGAVLVTA